MKLFTEDLSDYEAWSGAVSTYERIKEEGMLDVLERLIDDLYPEGLTFTQLNDLLWFDGEWVLEQLGISEEEEEEEDTRYCDYIQDTIFCDGICANCGNCKK